MSAFVALPGRLRLLGFPAAERWKILSGHHAGLSLLPVRAVHYFTPK